MGETRWLPCVAAVEWHSGARGMERPAALRLGEERLEVVVEDSWVAGSATAGDPTARVFLVRDPTRRRWRVLAHGSGAVGVEREGG